MIHGHTYKTQTHIEYTYYGKWVQRYTQNEYKVAHIIQNPTSYTDTHIMYIRWRMSTKRYTWYRMTTRTHTYYNNTHILQQHTHTRQRTHATTTHTYYNNTHIPQQRTHATTTHTYYNNTHTLHQNTHTTTTHTHYTDTRRIHWLRAMSTKTHATHGSDWSAYASVSISTSVSMSLCVYIYVCVYVSMHLCVSMAQVWGGFG